MRMSDYTPASLQDTDYDECECGDYRHQHEAGTGRCTMPNDLTHGFKACPTFRLHKRATPTTAEV